MEFNARAAKLLIAGEHLIVSGAPGLRLVATESLRTWTYRYKSPVDGRMRQIRLGRWPAMGLPAALAAWERLRALRDAGGDPAAEKRQGRADATAEGKAARYTVRRACDEYLADYRRHVAHKTYAEAARILARELGAFGDIPAAEVKRAQAFDLLTAMQSRPVVAGRLRQLLGAVWDRSIDSGRLPDETPNWWRLILRGKLQSKGRAVAGKKAGVVVKRHLTDAELSQLIPFLPNFSRDVCDVLRLYLWTCCRGAEIVQLERGELTEEPDGLWWTIPRHKLKMRRNPLLTDLRVPLVGAADAIIRRRVDAETGPLLFPSPNVRGKPVQQKAIGQAVWSHMPYAETRPEWIRPRLPVTHFAPHDLRRTSRTILARLGCPNDVAEAILGHMAPGVQAAYNRHSYDAERRIWLTRLSAHLDSLSCGPALGQAC